MKRYYQMSDTEKDSLQIANKRGLMIQHYSTTCNDWVSCRTPSFLSDVCYRIHPNDVDKSNKDDTLETLCSIITKNIERGEYSKAQILLKCIVDLKAVGG
jgi:hypothetical protein